MGDRTEIKPRQQNFTFTAPTISVLFICSKVAGHGNLVGGYERNPARCKTGFATSSALTQIDVEFGFSQNCGMLTRDQVLQRRVTSLASGERSDQSA